MYDEIDYKKTVCAQTIKLVSALLKDDIPAKKLVDNVFFIKYCASHCPADIQSDCIVTKHFTL